jgi:hypothetical protein
MNARFGAKTTLAEAASLGLYGLCSRSLPLSYVRTPCYLASSHVSIPPNWMEVRNDWTIQQYNDDTSRASISQSNSALEA